MRGLLAASRPSFGLFIYVVQWLLVLGWWRNAGSCFRGGGPTWLGSHVCTGVAFPYLASSPSPSHSLSWWATGHADAPLELAANFAAAAAMVECSPPIGSLLCCVVLYVATTAICAPERVIIIMMMRRRRRRWNHGFSPKPWVYENGYKTVQVPLMFTLSYTKSGVGLLKAQFSSLS